MCRNPSNLQNHDDDDTSGGPDLECVLMEMGLSKTNTPVYYSPLFFKHTTFIIIMTIIIIIVGLRRDDYKWQEAVLGWCHKSNQAFVMLCGRSQTIHPDSAYEDAYKS